MSTRTARIRSARDLGFIIAEARHSQGWTQTSLAEATSIDRSYLARIEAGASVIFLERVFRLLRRLGVEMIALLPEAETDASAQEPR